MKSSQIQLPKVTAEAGIDVDAVTSSSQFQDWYASVSEHDFDVRSIHIQSVDMFGKRLGFAKLKADVYDQAGNFLPGIVFLRGGAVGILPVFRCEGEEYAVLTVQPRFPAGQFEFVEIPAGMLDGSGKFAGKAADELAEELQVTISQDELTDLSAFAGHGRGFFSSPGGSDEFVHLFSFCRDVSREELDAMEGRCTGLLEEGEQIKLTIKPLDELWRIGDGKTIVAYTLYRKMQDSSV